MRVIWLTTCPYLSGKGGEGAGNGGTSLFNGSTVKDESHLVHCLSFLSSSVKHTTVHWLYLKVSVAWLTTHPSLSIYEHITITCYAVEGKSQLADYLSLPLSEHITIHLPHCGR